MYDIIRWTPGLLSRSGTAAGSGRYRPPDEYTTSGTSVNRDLITGLNGPTGIAVSGSDLSAGNKTTGSISEYTSSGKTSNAQLIGGALDEPSGIALSSVPEPGTWSLLGTGLIGLAGMARRKLKLWT